MSTVSGQLTLNEVGLGKKNMELGGLGSLELWGPSKEGQLPLSFI